MSGSGHVVNGEHEAGVSKTYLWPTALASSVVPYVKSYSEDCCITACALEASQ